METSPLTDAELLHVLNLLVAAGLEIRAPDGTENEESTTHHEAGHAVIARVLGGTVTCVSIVNEDRAAQIEHADYEQEGIAEDERLRRVETVAKTLLAGPVAERRKAGACRGWGGDVPRFARLLMSNASTSRGGTEWLKKLVDATNKLANQHWDEIVAVANALQQKKTLTGPEIAEVLARLAIPDRRPPE